MELVGIPYFTFRDLPLENSSILKVYADKESFEALHFKFEESTVSIFSTINPKDCLAIIRLPVKITESDAKVTCADEESASFRCYSLLLRKNEDHSDVNLLDLDVISKFLSWECDYAEEAVVLSDQLNSEDDLSKLLLKKLTLENTTENPISEKDGVGCYGFASRYKNELVNSEVDWQNVIDCTDPDSSDQKTRYLARWENERQSFDVDHYLADYFFETEEDGKSLWLCECLNYHPYYEKMKSPNEKILTPSQMNVLAGLPCKNFRLSPVERLEVLHSLFDIILAYAYDCRINEGVFSSESSWNISKLSSTLSWFQAHKRPRDVIISFYRRSSTFPLMRHLALSEKVLQDALVIFHLGRRQILNCLVSIYELFDDDDDRKIFNKLYLEDYLIWIQQVHPQTIENYAKLIESCELVQKEDIFSTLPSIESAATDILQEDEDEYEEWCQLSKKVHSLVQSKNSSNSPKIFSVADTS